MSEWRVIKSHPNYEVSEEGIVRRVRDERVRSRNGIARGYRIITLWHENVATTLSVHRIVAKAFHGEPLPGQEVRHLDGNRLNNHQSNLRWGTPKENAADRHIHGTALNRKQNQTHCKNGHPLSGENLRVGKQPNGRPVRLCRTCTKESQRRYEATRKKTA